MENERASKAVFLRQICMTTLPFLSGFCHASSLISRGMKHLQKGWKIRVSLEMVHGMSSTFIAQAIHAPLRHLEDAKEKYFRSEQTAHDPWNLLVTFLGIATDLEKRCFRSGFDNT